MRRIRPNLTYKADTAILVKDTYEPWQRTYRDAREGMHRILNRLVSMGDEVLSERDYIRGKFMPQTIDITETDTVWFIPSGETPDDVYLNGIALSAQYTVTDTVDALLDGIYDDFTIHSLHPTPVTFTDMTGHISPYIYGLSKGSVYKYDLTDNTVTTCEETSTEYASFVIYVDTASTIFAIPEHADLATVTVVDSANNRVVFDLLTHATATGAYMPIFDRDHDGIIWDDDRQIIEAIRGKAQSDMTPQEWADVEDLDYTGDLRIGNDDLMPFDNAYHSLSDAIPGALRIRGNRVGIMTVRYAVERPGIVAIDDSETYAARYAADPISQFGTSVWHDPVLDVYFAIASDGFLHVIKRGIFDSIANDHRIHVPLWNSAAHLLDVLVWNGYLWILATDGNIHKLFMADVYVEQIFTTTHEYVLPLPWVPTSFTVLQSGRMVIAGSSQLAQLQPKRRVVYRSNNLTYLTNHELLTNKAGQVVPVISQSVFNSFDAFAFNLGLTRSYGKNNTDVYNLIMNAGAFPNGHTSAAMKNVILRELGDLAIQNEVFPYQVLPNRLDTTHRLYIDGLPATVTTVSTSIRTIVTTAGSWQLHFDRILERLAPTAHATYQIDGYWIDGDGVSRNLDAVAVTFASQYDDTRVRVQAFTDAAFLRDNAYVTDAGVTEKLRTYMLAMDTTHPALISNVTVNMWPFDFVRTPIAPLVATGYNPVIDISDDEQLTI